MLLTISYRYFPWEGGGGGVGGGGEIAKVIPSFFDELGVMDFTMQKLRLKHFY